MSFSFFCCYCFFFNVDHWSDANEWMNEWIQNLTYLIRRASHKKVKSIIELNVLHSNSTKQDSVTCCVVQIWDHEITQCIIADDSFLFLIQTVYKKLPNTAAVVVESTLTPFYGIKCTVYYLFTWCCLGFYWLSCYKHV